MTLKELYKNNFIKISSIVLLISVLFYGLSFAYISISEARINAHIKKTSGIDLLSSQTKFTDSMKTYLSKMPSKPFEKFSNNQKRRIIINSLAGIETHLNSEIMWNSKKRSYGGLQKTILKYHEISLPKNPNRVP